MSCDRLRDDQWDCLKASMPGVTRGWRGPRIIDALLFMARFGGRWRDRPAEDGYDQSVKRRHHRWIEMGVLDDIMSVLGQDAALEWLMIDATIARARQHAAGARKEKGDLMLKVWAGLGAV